MTVVMVRCESEGMRSMDGQGAAQLRRFWKKRMMGQPSHASAVPDVKGQDAPSVV